MRFRLWHRHILLQGWRISPIENNSRVAHCFVESFMPDRIADRLKPTDLGRLCSKRLYSSLNFPEIDLDLYQAALNFSFQSSICLTLYPVTLMPHSQRNKHLLVRVDEI